MPSTMPEIVITDSNGNELLRKPESDFIRAELKKASRPSSGIVTIFTLELELGESAELEEYSDLTSGNIKLINNGVEKGLQIDGFDEYKVYVNRENKTVESLSLSGTII